MTIDLETFSAASLRASSKPKPKMSTAEEFKATFATRLTSARLQGATSVLITADDGFRLYHPDGDRRALPDQLIEALNYLAKQGFALLKESGLDKREVIKVSFALEPDGVPVDLEQLATWGR